MPSQKPIIPITVVITIALIAILMVSVAWWYMNNKTTNIACNTDTNCILAYTGDQPCAPCDYAHADYKCVSSEQAKRLEQERIAGGVMCKLCDLSPLLYRCTCQGKAGKACIKIAVCTKDEDCYSKSFGEQYKCKSGKCSYTKETTNTNTGTTACADYTIDEEYKITDTSKQPQGTWAEMKSPNDNSILEVIVLDPDDPLMLDESWRHAYYSQTENIFWIADMPGEFFGGWYGPFKEKPCSTCDEALCAKYGFGYCPAGCVERCMPSSCTDTPQGRVCTTDCGGPGSCACPSSTNTNTVTTNTNTSSDSKYCNQDSDCGLLICGGCYSKEYLKTAPSDLPCREYDGYACQCVKNRCLEIKPDRPYDFPSIRNEADCLALGAEWMVSAEQITYCEIKAPDVGKSCTKATDCIKYCSIENMDDTTGTCSVYYLGSGCHRYLDEEGKQRMICVD